MQQSDELTETVEGVDADRVSGEADDDAAGRLDGLFSLKAFALAVGLVVLGVVVGGAIPLVGSIGSLVGVFLAAFLLGSIVSQSRYLEIGLAGGGVVGVTFALSLLTSVALPIGLDFFQQYGLAFGAVGAGLGALLAVLGHYFGRDLRTGLTREI